MTDHYLNAQLQELAQKLGVHIDFGPSYPGHDVSNMISNGIRRASKKAIKVLGQLILIPSRNGSHNPDEAVDLKDLGTAAVLHKDMMLRLASNPSH